MKRILFFLPLVILSSCSNNQDNSGKTNGDSIAKRKGIISADTAFENMETDSLSPEIKNSVSDVELLRDKKVQKRLCTGNWKYWEFFNKRGEKIEWQAADSSNKPLEQYEFNDQGVELEYRTFSGDTMDYSEHFIYKDTQCIKIIYKIPPHFSDSVTIHHDENGRWIKLLDQKEGETDFFYDDQGRLAKSIQIFSDSSGRMTDKYFYNKLGWLVMHQEWIDNGPKDIYFFQYDSLGRHSKTIRYQEGISIDNPSSVIRWVYDPEGLPAEQYRIHHTDSLQGNYSGDTIRYKYFFWK
jgi:hypothetical protein